MGNVTINIKNCGCGGGKASGGSSTDKGQWNELGDPSSPEGPPEGYSYPTSGLSDRQCKMAVWLYAWIEAAFDFLGNQTAGAVILGFLRGISDMPASTIVTRLAARGVQVLASMISGGIITAMYAILGVAVPGPIDEAIVFVISSALFYTVINGLVGGGYAFLFTQNYVLSLIPKIQANKSDIICTLAQATSATDAKQRLTDYIDDAAGFTPDDEVFILSIIPDMFLTMLYFQPDWWPSFDDDYLADITTACCGGAINDTPITPGSVESCQASYYIIQQLAATMQAVADTGGIWYNWNPFDNDRPEIYEWLENNLATPRKIRERAFSYSSFLNAVTEITYSKFFLNIHFANLSEFEDFGAYINSQVATLTAALQTAANTQDAYDELQPLRDWITTNIEPGDSVVADYMQQALDALIQIPDGRPGILDLLLLQDVDLANYGLAECGGSCPVFNPVHGTIVNQVGNVYTIQSQQLEPNQGSSHYISLHFGQSDDGLNVTCGPAQDIVVNSINQSNNHSPEIVDYTWRLSHTSFLGTSGTGASWDEGVENWSPHIGIQKNGVRTLTLYRFGTTQFEAEIEVV